MWVTSVIPWRSKFQKTRNLKRNDYDHHQKSGWVYSSHDQDAKFKFDRGWTTTITKIWTGHLGGQVKFPKTGFLKLLWLHFPSKNEREWKKKNGLLKKVGSRVVKMRLAAFWKEGWRRKPSYPSFGAEGTWEKFPAIFGGGLQPISSFFWRKRIPKITIFIRKQ